MVDAAPVDTQNAYLVLNHAADWMPSTSATTARQRGRQNPSRISTRELRNSGIASPTTICFGGE
jgi:hypothetical protein